MSYAGIVCKLQNVRPHPNADRLKLATVYGSQVIVGLENKDGDMGIFFGSDGKLSPRHLYECNLFSNPEMNKDTTKSGYFGKNGRIRAQKLRGSVSDGFWQEIASFGWTYGISVLKDGDEVTHLNDRLICEKYYTPATLKAMNTKTGKPGKVKKKPVSYVNFKKHYDTKQLRQYVGQIPEGAILHISEKLHGTSGRTGLVNVKLEPTWWDKVTNFFRKDEHEFWKWEYLTGTRNTVVDFRKGDAYYNNTSFRKILHHKIKDIGLHHGETLYYEIVGYTDTGKQIMPSHGVTDKKMIKELMTDRVDYNYGCAIGEYKMYVYRITMTNNDGVAVEYSWPQVEARCGELGLKTVPVIEEPTYEVNAESFEEYSQGPSALGGRIKEGIVVRVEHKDMWMALKHKSWNFKVLEGIVKDNADYVDTEEVS